MDRRDMARYVVWRHVAGWLLALAVLLVAYFFVDSGQFAIAPALVVVAFAIFVVTPVLYWLVRRALGERD